MRFRLYIWSSAVLVSVLVYSSLQVRAFSNELRSGCEYADDNHPTSWGSMYRTLSP